jgi:hypothetical protein
MNIPCRLCGNNTRLLFSQRVLFKHDVSYFRCDICDLIQSETPYWLDEAYKSALTMTDTGAIARNALCAQLTSVIARLIGITPTSTCADFGGGHGVFVRMMRDKGLDFRLCDKYAQNLFARGFDTDVSRRFDLLTTFEVFEHFPSVANDLQTIFAPQHDFVLAGTVLHRGHREGWWYYSPEGGQHVAFYSMATMRHIGARFGYHALPGPAYTLFIRRDHSLATWRRHAIAKLLRDTRPNRNSKWIRALDAVLPRYQSLVERDSAAMAKQAA